MSLTGPAYKPKVVFARFTSLCHQLYYNKPVDTVLMLGNLQIGLTAQQIFFHGGGNNEQKNNEVPHVQTTLLDLPNHFVPLAVLFLIWSSQVSSEKKKNRDWRLAPSMNWKKKHTDPYAVSYSNDTKQGRNHQLLDGVDVSQPQIPGSKMKIFWLGNMGLGYTTVGWKSYCA